MAVQAGFRTRHLMTVAITAACRHALKTDVIYYYYYYYYYVLLLCIIIIIIYFYYLLLLLLLLLSLSLLLFIIIINIIIIYSIFDSEYNSLIHRSIPEKPSSFRPPLISNNFILTWSVLENKRHFVLMPLPG